MKTLKHLLFCFGLFIPFGCGGGGGGGGGLANSAWPKFHHDSLNSGRGAGSGATGIKKWEFLTGGVVDSSPAIGADGTVYIGSDDHKVYAIK